MKAGAATIVHAHDGRQPVGAPDGAENIDLAIPLFISHPNINTRHKVIKSRGQGKKTTHITTKGLIILKFHIGARQTDQVHSHFVHPAVAVPPGEELTGAAAFLLRHGLADKSIGRVGEQAAVPAPFILHAGEEVQAWSVGQAVACATAVAGALDDAVGCF